MNYNCEIKKYGKEKIDELYDIVCYYLNNGIEVAGRDENMKFSLLDYYCLTDVNHNEMMAYAVKRNNFANFNTRVTIFFRNAIAGVTLDESQMLNNKYKFINKDGEFLCDEEMCTYLFEQFRMYQIPLKSDLLCEAFYRKCRGDLIFPLLTSSQAKVRKRTVK